ncbi:protein kinase, putative [Bodo saltans]|uniref:Protein kinase, putative n=1 Tax=Bodo saltans TaxID=75058 RepID=A0A0S4J173_BODSA|nr:protein kinase, putative [Bodo saltans]|eukprot:CUG07562.1 protein kinase, putative [Bodo saltans]
MYIAMEYAAQGSLLSQIKRVPLAEEVAAPFLFQTLCGLSYLHRRKVIHRDIKAANILLGESGVAKLTDFGLATPTEATGQKMEQLTMLVGSVYWMSPESISKGIQSESGDVWSVGCTAIELVTGVPPFFDRTPVNALYHIAESTESPVPNTVSELMQDFLACCLQRNPDVRAKLTELVHHEWFASCGVDTSVVPDGDLASLLSTTHNSSGSPAGGAVSSIAQEVERYLFGDRLAEREDWLKSGGLATAVNALTTITAEDSYRIVRSLAFESQRAASESSVFFESLGDTEFWGLDLVVLATMDTVATLFSDCCDHQPPTCRNYAPSHKHALQLVLRSSDVGPQCISALHRLLVCRLDGEASASTDAPKNRRELRHSSMYIAPTVSTDAARVRFLADDGIAVLRDIVQSMCLQAFREKTEPLVRWENIDKLLEIVLSFAPAAGSDQEDNLPTMGDNWLIAVQEACMHNCPSALHLLMYSIDSRDGIVSGERVIVGRLISVGSQPLLDYETRLKVAECLPRLQAQYPEASKALCDVHGNIPLITHMMRHAPPSGSVDSMLSVLTALCESGDMAEACASYDGMLTLVIQKILEAQQRGSPQCLDRSLRLTELLFSRAPHPEWFVTSRQLTQRLIEIIGTPSLNVESSGNPESADAKCRTSAVTRAKRLLNALAAQSISV